MNTIIKDSIGIGCIFVAIVIFFARLFGPIPQLLVTQDLGRSDAWHFSFATKYALSQSLKHKELPLWRNDIGDGFPLFAEGQTGALYIPNILAFSILDPVRAYAFIMAFAIGSLATGMYLWARTFGLHPIAAYFAGITSGFCAYPIMQLPHITLLQGISVMPYLLVVTYILVRKGSLMWTGIFAILLSQQIMAGFPQATFITLILCCWYAGWLALQHKRGKYLGFLVLAIILGIGMGAAQWLPSLEFLSHSTFPHGFELQKAAQYSFPLKDLWSLVTPFAVGNPKMGTYPSAFQMEGNIVWENTIYLGLLPLLSLVYVAFFHRRTAAVKFFFVTSLIALLLAWGKYSPVYLLYSIWPMNLFRVPSRFIWITAIMLILLASEGINALYKKTKNPTTHMLIIIFVIMHSAQLIHMWWNYNLFVPADTWMRTPKIVGELGSGRLTTIAEENVQLREFVTHGWANPAPYYEFRKGLSPMSNIIWEVNQHDVYAGRFLLRTTVLDDLLNRQSITTDTHHATTSALTIKLLNLFGVTDVISFIPLTANGLIPIQTNTQNSVSISHYKNPTALPHAYMVTQATTAATFEELGQTLQDPTFIAGKSVVLESHQISSVPGLAAWIKKQTNMLLPTVQNVSSAEIRSQSHTNVVIHTKNDVDSLLVLSDTNYPGWIATVDSRQTPILNANFTQRAIFVPAGEHAIVFSYPGSIVKRGMWICVASLIITIGLMVFPWFFGTHRMSQTTVVHAWHPPRSRGT